LTFATRKLAEDYLDLIKWTMPHDVYLGLRKTRVYKKTLEGDQPAYQFELNSEQFQLLAIGLNTEVQNITYAHNKIFKLLKTAIENNNPDQIRNLLAQYPCLKNFPGYNGHAPIHSAVKENNTALVRLLLEEFLVDVNFTNQVGK